MLKSFTLLAMSVSIAVAQVSVLTQHYDVSRSGANLNETTLNTSNVNVNQFGKLFVRSVDAQIYAQPLYVPNVQLSSGIKNVVYVATENNSVYAFDADSPTASTPIWHVNLGPPVPSSAICTTDTAPDIGITSTPVIDPATNTIYVEAKTSESTGYYHRLHALDVTTGAEKFNGPIVIRATVNGTGGGSSGGQISFDALHQLNRPGLLLANGWVYLGFGSHCDVEYYHGWVMAYGLDPTGTTLQQKAVYIDTANNFEGGIWQSGQGLAADSSGNIYLVTGNGGFDYNTGGTDLGDSFIKLTPSLTVADYFTPYNQQTLSNNDLDLGSAGPLLLPALPNLPSGVTNVMVGGGKQGILYLLNRDSLGHYNSTSDNVLEEWQAASGHIFGSPVFWNGAGGMWLYVWSASDNLKQYQWSTGSFTPTPVHTAGESAPQPGGILALSANGSAAGTGILWATMPASTTNQATVPGILRAYDASNVSNELWNSYQNQSRDDFGTLAKFCPPVIANGKVYVATFSNELAVYGLLAAGGDTQPPTAPSSLKASTTATTVTLTWTASTDNVGVAGYYVYRTLSGITTKLGPTTATTFTDSGLQKFTTYTYYVEAFDAAGNYSAPSNTVKVKTKK